MRGHRARAHHTAARYSRRNGAHTGLGHHFLTEAWDRPYLQPCSQKPHLFFAVLGEFDFDAETREFSEDLAQGLVCRLIEANYFRQGELWDTFLREQPQLAQRALAAPCAVVVDGEVESHDDLGYLRYLLDFLAYLGDRGGEVVYDPYTFSWFSSQDWEHRVDQGQIFNPFDHVLLLASPEDEGTSWLHTRGMLKFGRPDLSVRAVPEADIPAVKKMIDRFISYQALGGVLEEGREVTMEGLERRFVPGPVLGSREDPDFNNFHVEFSPL